jgi:hypothetical protein
MSLKAAIEKRKEVLTTEGSNKRQKTSQEDGEDEVMEDKADQ